MLSRQKPVVFLVKQFIGGEPLKLLPDDLEEGKGKSEIMNYRLTKRLVYLKFNLC